MSNAAPPPAPANTTNPQNATPAAAQAPGTAARNRPDMLAQPLVLLTGLVTNVVFLVAYGLYTYYPIQRCLVGPLCQFESFPLWNQVGLILLAYGVMWVLLFIFAARALEETGRRGNFLVETVRALSRFQPIRPLLLFYGVALLLGLLAVFLLSSLSAPLITVVAVTAIVCFWGSRERAARPPTDPYGAIGGADYQARRLLPLRWFRPNPQPPGGAGGNGANPGNAGNAGNPGNAGASGGAGNAGSPGNA